jgi:membrane protease YdiL (CAAX protease family)
MPFQGEFDRVALALSLAAIMILLYFGLANPGFFQDYWVAFAFWIVGFFGSLLLGFTKRTAQLSFNNLVMIGVMTGALLGIFLVLNIVYGINQPQEIQLSSKFLSLAIGISEELFFGVFIIGFLINWLGFPAVIAILVSAGSHSLYHIPNWGANPQMLMLFFACFAIARSVYVFIFRKVGMLLAAHGIWNWGVS